MKIGHKIGVSPNRRQLNTIDRLTTLSNHAPFEF